MKKVLKVIAGLLAACATLAAFGALSWWVSTEGSAVGYIAAVLFGIVAFLGAILAYIAIVFEDKNPSVSPAANKTVSEDKLDPGTMAAAMLVATSDQFHDDVTGDVDVDLEVDVDLDGSGFDDIGGFD